MGVIKVKTFISSSFISSWINLVFYYILNMGTQSSFFISGLSLDL